MDTGHDTRVDYVNYDVIVVGAGFAGLSAAVDLAERGAVSYTHLRAHET